MVVKTHTSPIHPRGELILGQWDEWTVFYQVTIGFFLPSSLGLWPRRVLLGTMGTWKHMDGTWKGWTGMGAVWPYRRGASWHRPSLPDGSKYFLWAWATPWLGKLGPSLAVGTQDLSQMRKDKGLPCPGLLHRCAKVQRGSIWRVRLLRNHASLGRVGGGVFLASGTRKRKEDSPGQIRTWLDPARASQS